MNDRTHWAECWKDHHDCAIAEVIRLRELLLRYEMLNNAQSETRRAEVRRLLNIAKASGRISDVEDITQSYK